MNDVNGPALQLFDKHHQQRAMLRLNKDDVPSLRLYDEDGKLRSVSGFNLNTLEPQFILFDNEGNGRAINNNAVDTGLTTLSSLYRDEDTAHSGMMNWVTSSQSSDDSVNVEIMSTGDGIRVINSDTPNR